MDNSGTQTLQDRPTVEKALLSPEEFRQALGCTFGRNTLYDWLVTGRIKSIRAGNTRGRYLIPRSELQDFLTREAA